jgi:hypothetical protein
MVKGVSQQIFESHALTAFYQRLGKSQGSFRKDRDKSRSNLVRCGDCRDGNETAQKNVFRKILTVRPLHQVLQSPGKAPKSGPHASIPLRVKHTLNHLVWKEASPTDLFCISLPQRKVSDYLWGLTSLLQKLGDGGSDTGKLSVDCGCHRTSASNKAQ